MISGAWMCPREDEAVLKICWEPRHSEQPCADSERAQRWRLSLASLLFFTVLLSDHLWLVSAGAKARGSFSFSLQPAQGEQANSSLTPLQQSFFPGEGRGCWDTLLSNLTKSAAHSPHCTGTSSSFSSTTWSNQPFPFSSKRNFLKAYFRNLTLSFCNTYTILDLLLGMPNPDSLNCSLEKLMEDFPGAAAASTALLEGEVCSSCVQAYQRLDQHAQEKYEEFDFVLEKYLQSGEYSVRGLSSTSGYCLLCAQCMCLWPGKCVALYPLRHKRGHLPRGYQSWPTCLIKSMVRMCIGQGPALLVQYCTSTRDIPCALARAAHCIRVYTNGTFFNRKFMFTRFCTKYSLELKSL
uniref:NALCN channel auxiliary factor 2 n=1 Tax=Leptobrachium leishanense TaxID=445787 RepID=A0A8C5QN89_9ANUR